MYNGAQPFLVGGTGGAMLVSVSASSTAKDMDYYVKCYTANCNLIWFVPRGTSHIGCLCAPAVHLIADRLKWFGDEETSIETILKEKGEVLRRLSGKHMGGSEGTDANTYTMFQFLCNLYFDAP